MSEASKDPFSGHGPVAGLPEPPRPNLPDYELVGELGRGGMGVVYRARQRSTGLEVALKVLPSSADEGMIRRFDQEIRIARMLDHPDIVRVYDTGWGEDYAWIAMEILDGFELWEAMPDPRFTLEDRISVIARVALALHYAHEQGIVHRDVKPSNIYLTRDGGVRLLDFGVAKMKDVRLTKTGKTVGTPQYMAPEQIMAQGVDARTDVFALASVAYEVLTGQPPWTAEHDHALMMAICTKPPRPFRDAFAQRAWFELSAPALRKLHTLIHKSLAGEPTRRHQTTLELAEALEGFLVWGAGEEAEAGEAPPAQPEVPQERWSERRIDWARARAARIRVKSMVPDSEDGIGALDAPSEPPPAPPPPRSIPEDEDEDEGDKSQALWIGLVAVFVLGLGVAAFFLMR
jgi:serine/threonine protein kinase